MLLLHLRPVDVLDSYDTFIENVTGCIGPWPCLEQILVGWKCFFPDEADVFDHALQCRARGEKVDEKTRTPTGGVMGQP